MGLLEDAIAAGDEEAGTGVGRAAAVRGGDGGKASGVKNLL